MLDRHGQIVETGTARSVTCTFMRGHRPDAVMSLTVTKSYSFSRLDSYHTPQDSGESQSKSRI